MLGNVAWLLKRIGEKLPLRNGAAGIILAAPKHK